MAPQQSAALKFTTRPMAVEQQATRTHSHSFFRLVESPTCCSRLRRALVASFSFSFVFVFQQHLQPIGRPPTHTLEGGHVVEAAEPSAQW